MLYLSLLLLFCEKMSSQVFQCWSLWAQGCSACGADAGSEEGYKVLINSSNHFSEGLLYPGRRLCNWQSASPSKCYTPDPSQRSLVSILTAFQSLQSQSSTKQTWLAGVLGFSLVQVSQMCHFRLCQQYSDFFFSSASEKIILQLPHYL